MKKNLIPSTVIILSLVLFFILRATFPKNTGPINFLLIYLFLTWYLWRSVQACCRKLRKVFRILFTFFFWLPVIILLGLVIYGFFIPFIQWNLFLKIEVVSLFLITFLSTFLPITGLIIADILRIARWGRLYLLGKSRLKFREIKRNRWLILTSWSLGAIFFLLLLMGMKCWKYDFRIKEQHINLADLPPSFKGLRIIQVSDIHLGSWLSKQKLSEAVNLINQTRPDIVFFTGDMFNYCTEEGNGFQGILKGIIAPMGVYAILGNHDYGDYMHWPDEASKVNNMKDLESWYRELGWILLRNQHVIIYRDNDSIALIGVENWGSTRRFQRFGDIDKAIRGTEKIALQILLSHDPTHWDSIISKRFTGIDLTLSGHTHGGQFGIEDFGIHWSPISLAYQHYCGLYKNPHSIQPQYLYINQGLGTIGYSGRVGIRPEISLIILE